MFSGLEADLSATESGWKNSLKPTLAAKIEALLDAHRTNVTKYIIDVESDTSTFFALVRMVGPWEGEVGSTRARRHAPDVGELLLAGPQVVIVGVVAIAAAAADDDDNSKMIAVLLGERSGNASNPNDDRQMGAGTAAKG